MLEVSRIDTYRGAAQILHGVSLSVGPQEVVCLVGRNGAGKTTTIDSIMGLLATRSGTVRFEAQDITALPPKERARRGIGYAPEDCGIFPDLTVAQNLMIAKWLSPRARGNGGPSGARHEDRALSIFPEVEAFTDRRGMNLSGGQKKMVAIARAIAISPSLLLLDEPFEGLAQIVVTRFIEAVTQIKQLGISLLIAVSNLPTAVRIADRMYVIDRGEIIFQGAPSEALANAAVVQTLRG